MDAARLADVAELRRVLLDVDAVDANVAEPPPAPSGMSNWLIW